MSRAEPNLHFVLQDVEAAIVHRRRALDAHPPILAHFGAHRRRRRWKRLTRDHVCTHLQHTHATLEHSRTRAPSGPVTSHHISHGGSCGLSGVRQHYWCVRRTRGGRMQCTKEWNGTAQHIECLVSVVH